MTSESVPRIEGDVSKRRPDSSPERDMLERIPSCY
jgi:hypothetical protein